MTKYLFPALRALLAYPRYLATDLAEFATTVTRYYRNPQFRRADIRCLLAYLVHTPETICHRYLRHYSDNEVQKIYGETFFTTLEVIADAVRLQKDDVIYDLGCGRGRSVFWFNAIVGCRAIGVEINPTFITKAKKIQKKVGFDNVEFLLANVMDLDYGDATVIYLYGSAFNEAAITRLVNRFKTLKPGTRVVSVSYSLNPYADGDAPLFVLEQKITGKYLWGSTDVYIQRKI